MSTSRELIASMVAKQQAHFASGATRPLKARLEILSKLQDSIKAREGEIHQALFEHRVIDAVRIGFGTEEDLVLVDRAGIAGGLG